MSHGLVCLSSPQNNRLSRSAWDQTFIDENASLLNVPSPFLRCQLQQGRVRGVMNPRGLNHDYQNSNEIRMEPRFGNGLVRIPLGSEWDAVKLPKDESTPVMITDLTMPHETNILPPSASTSRTSIDLLADGCDDEAAKVRNSLRTVVRRAAGSLNSPPRSPLVGLRSPRPIMISSSDLDVLLSAPTTPSAPVSPRISDLPQTSLLPPIIPPKASSSRIYQNGDVQFFRDFSSSCDSRTIARILPRPGSTVSGLTGEEMMEISVDNVYLQRGSTCCDERSLSSFDSHSISSSRLSSISSEFRADASSDSGSSGLAGNHMLDADCALTVDSCSADNTLDAELAHAANLASVRARLTSCRFYMGKMSADEARVALLCCSEGTFLLRDSADSRFVFSISVQTSRGPTSIRVGYHSGRFHLDSEPRQAESVPRFDCVLELIRFYTRLDVLSARKRLVLVEETRRRGDCPVVLRRPYERSPASLLENCRRAINRQLDGRSPQRLCLVPSLKDYLMEYQCDL